MDQTDPIAVKYKALGIDASSVDDQYVFDVGLNFTAEQWVDLMNIEGESLGACCAIISEIRDKLASALRFEQRISAGDLCDVVRLIEYHDCDTEDNAELDYLVKLWETIKDDVRPDTISQNVQPLDMANLDEIVSTMGFLVQTYTVHKLLPYKEENISDNATRIALMRLMPVVKALHDHLVDANIQPVDGYALYLNGEIAKTNGLPTVFATRKFAEELLRDMSGNGEVHKVVVDMDGVRIND